jgi:hypothetical protein
MLEYINEHKINNLNGLKNYMLEDKNTRNLKIKVYT